MSYPGETEYDDTTEGIDTPGDDGLMALAGAPEVSRLLNKYETNVKARNERLNKEVFGPQQELWNKYTKDLEARRAGPGFSERMYELASALMKPTDYKGFSATFGNVAPVLAKQRATLREAEDAKRDLMMKYQMQMQEAKGAQLKNLLTSEGDVEKARLNAMLAQYKIANTPRWVQVPDGKGGVTLMQVTPSSLPAQGAVSRPAGVPPDWVLHTDAQGNSAYVSPDGKQFKEVQ